MLGISLFGWLDRIPFWRDLPYPIKGALLRAFKAAAAGFVGVLVAALAAGTLLPTGLNPVIVLVVTAGLQAIDKFIREQKIADEIPVDTGEDVEVTVDEETPPVLNEATDTTTIGD